MIRGKVTAEAAIGGPSLNIRHPSPFLQAGHTLSSSWPGELSLEGGTVTFSHGVQMQAALLAIAPAMKLILALRMSHIHPDHQCRMLG